MNTLTIINVILGVVAASIMPNHAAFMHHNALTWMIVYTLDLFHGIFMYVPTVQYTQVYDTIRYICVR